jgi:HK97 family phage major capsid protein
MSIQDLREQRAAKAKTLRELVNKTDWIKDRDAPAADTLSNEIGDIDDRIQRIETANALAAERAERDGVIDAADRIAKDKRSPQAAAFAKFMRFGAHDLTPEEARFFATMSVGTGSQGGYTVPTETAASVLDALKAFGGMRKVANTIRTENGDPINFPTSNGTSEVGELVAENSQAASLDLSFGVLNLPVYKYSSKVVTVPIELLQDSAVDIEAFVRKRLVTRLGRITNTHFTVGTGSSQPNGIVTAAGVGKIGASGETVTVIYDDLVDLEHSVDPAYREAPGCGWMMSDAMLKVIRKIKDTVGRPIFVPGYELQVPGGAPDELMGRPITINQDVPAPGAGNNSILFGAFGEYTIRDCMDIAMFRFTDSAFTIKGQVGFLAWMRAGGNLLDVGGGVKAFQHSAS